MLILINRKLKLNNKNINIDMTNTDTYCTIYYSKKKLKYLLYQ